MTPQVHNDERLLSRPQLAELVGCSPAHVRRMEVGDPNFPKPVRVSAGITRWRLSDVRAYFAALKPDSPTSSPMLLPAEPLV